MRADEFSIDDGKKVIKKKSSVKAKPKMTTESIAAVPESSIPKTVSKNPRVSMPAGNNSSITVYGVETNPGHEIHRIRKHNPSLWAKIKNWD